MAGLSCPHTRLAGNQRLWLLRWCPFNSLPAIYPYKAHSSNSPRVWGRPLHPNSSERITSLVSVKSRTTGLVAKSDKDHLTVA